MQMMRSYASSCVLDAQGRIRIPEALREFANLVKYITFIGQGNRCELWDPDAWVAQRDEWRSDIGRGVGTASEALRDLAL
ncbi:MAG: division/cell wall cluster transcriptional repressor MraZ [Gammaproteobacteria bacterium]